jgi:peptidoglycan DL-endopeptidase CwlO
VNRPGREPGRRADFHSPNPSADPVGRQWEKERVTQVHTPPSVGRIVRHGVTAVTVSVFAAGLLIGVSASASAKPAPTLSQAQAKLSKLQTQMEKLDQQYDQVRQQLSATDQRLALVNKQAAAYGLRFATLRQQITRIAITAYEDGNLSSSVALLTSGNPQQILNQSSILLELSASNDAQIDQFLAAAKQLTTTQLLAKRTKIGIQQLQAGLVKRRQSMQKLVDGEQSIVNQLTPAQQAAVMPGGGGLAKYTGPTSTQAEKAVAFAYSKLGCPYVYGGTGPCSAGYDCSGLTQASWAAAGIAIPRTADEQWNGLPHVSTADMQPGDIMIFNGGGHAGIYVGNNMLIDAPQPGMTVERVAFSGWYRQTFDGAVRP